MTQYALEKSVHCGTSNHFQCKPVGEKVYDTKFSSLNDAYRQLEKYQETKRKCKCQCIVVEC